MLIHAKIDYNKNTSQYNLRLSLRRIILRLLYVCGVTFKLALSGYINVQRIKSHFWFHALVDSVSCYIAAFNNLTISMSAEPLAKRSKMSALDQLKQFSTVVADTGDFEG